MKMQPPLYSCVVFLVCLSSVLGRGRIYYVKPDIGASPPVKCPGQPCLTLTQYMNTYAETTGSIFVFLTGNHSLESRIRLFDGSDIIFMKEPHGGDVFINCRDRADIVVNNVTRLSIIGLQFVYNSSDMVAFVSIVDSRNLLIQASVFRGSRKNYTALVIINTTIAINVSFFFNNAGGLQGAIFAVESAVNLTNCVFFNNEAVYRGGALYAARSNVTLIENFFSRNTARAEGGAIYADSSVIKMKNNNFANNSAKAGGGALSLLRSNVSLDSDIFTRNGARVRGGAIAANDSNISIGFNSFFLNSAQVRGGALYIDNCIMELFGNILRDNNALLSDDLFGTASIIYSRKDFDTLKRGGTATCMDCIIRRGPKDDGTAYLALNKITSLKKALKSVRLASLLLQGLEAMALANN